VGALTKQGSGTLIMTGDSTYTGGTTTAEGTLQLGNGGTTGSIIGDVTDNGTLTFNRSDVYTFDGAISGSGSVSQIGTTVLTGISTYSGTTTVTAGTLAVGDAANPSAALTGGGATSVAYGATFGGYGSVNGTVTNNGTIAVANAISAFSSAANGTFTIGGTLINNGLAQVGGSVLQGTWYENVKAQSSRNLMASSPVDVGLESKGFGMVGSLEVGYPLELTDNWILEPQAQVVYQRVTLNSASDVAATVRFAPATSMAERIGARLTTTRELDRGVESRLITPWVEANLWHESRGDNRTELSSEDGFVPFHSKLGGSWVAVGAGVTGQVTRNTSLFAHASYEFGLDGERQANSYAVGVRINW
jgi:autotransporter-associated beta strand protein